MEFTSWDAGLHAGDFDYLEHYGIPGMKWGVRRFQNADGSLTAKGEKRYGAGGKGGSARSMKRHLNKLDAGYANVEARRRSDAYTATRFARKRNKALAKGNTVKAEKMQAKALKYGLKAGAANKNKRAIEQLQWKIIGKAAQKGYTVSSKAVKRYGQDGKTAAAQVLAGAIGNAAYSLKKRGRNTAVVDGQKFKVSRFGDGTQKVVNYNNAQRLAAEELRRERARRMAYSHR